MMLQYRDEDKPPAMRTPRGLCGITNIIQEMQAERAGDVDRRRMLQILRAHEQQQADLDQLQADNTSDSDSDNSDTSEIADITQRFHGVDLDSMTIKEITERLTPTEIANFTKIARNPDTAIQLIPEWIPWRINGDSKDISSPHLLDMISCASIIFSAVADPKFVFESADTAVSALSHRLGTECHLDLIAIASILKDALIILSSRRFTISALSDLYRLASGIKSRRAKLITHKIYFLACLVDDTSMHCDSIVHTFPLCIEKEIARLQDMHQAIEASERSIAAVKSRSRKTSSAPLISEVD
eukprot:jgi/Hompol1/6216/HPOL_002215-RA